ncbi:uncharacterized protein LOC115033433 [Acyrthosiphon pisum]|uniref:Uncharacterized protein n=1 Tax=Acyrthosiphon pisum TaxID=7029 RepID=A0A8R2JLY8_ACYPI|nr:uncharacterized protein LOC115033433 [Acyrthosiphon pisum]
MESESSPQRHLENVNTPSEIDQAPLNSTTSSVPSAIIIISDSDDENNVDGNVVIVIDSDEDKNKIKRESLDRYNRRLKYKMRRAINILLRYNSHLSEENISYLENKKYEMRCGNNNRVVENVVNRVSRVESERPRSEKQILRGLQTLRRRYLEAIRASYEIIEIWLRHNVESDCDALTDCMKWASPFIINKKNYMPVMTSPYDGEVLSNDLDSFVKNIGFSDSESSSGESEISSGQNERTYDILYFDDGVFYENPSLNLQHHTNHTKKKPHNQNLTPQQRLKQRKQRLKQRKQWLKRRQQLRDRFKISRLEPGSLAGPDDVCVSDGQTRHQPSPRIDAITPALDDQESCINDELPCRCNNRQIVETNSLSSETATSSSHAITNDLLTTPIMRVQRRSRSRTRNHSTPRRLCTVSPPISRAHIKPPEQMREKSRSPLHAPGSPTLPLVPTIPRLSPSHLPRSPSTDTTTTTDIGASTVTTTTTGRPHLSQSPPEALGSTLQRVLTDDDDGASATLSQVALTLLELSEQ